MEESLVRYIHFVGIILLSSMLITENILFSKQLKDGLLKKLAIIDKLYVLGAILTFVAGMLLWLSVGKPKEFYTTNILFHVKLTVFLLVALLSLVPTIFLFKNRNNQTPTITVPHHIIFIRRIELVFLFVMPLLAVLVARGIGGVS